MTRAQTDLFLKICTELSSERDKEKLLSDILDRAMLLNHCDAGTLYLLSDAGLEFCRMVTKSMGIRQGGHDAPISLPPVPLEEKYVCSWSVIHGEPVYIDSVREDPRFDLSGSKRYDDMTGYYTGTMCVIPLTDEKGENIGAIQLINALDEENNICAFDKDIALLTSATASVAAISLTNMQYSKQIEELLNSLVRALSTAIDERTPYNANHTRNMVRYAQNFLDWLEANGNPMGFPLEDRDAFIMSVWLHDVGKLVVPLDVMNKPSRLGPAKTALMDRLRIIALLSRVDELEGRKTHEEAEALIDEIKDTQAFVERINDAGFLPDEDLERVRSLSQRTFTDETGAVQSWFTAQETEDLLVRRGTLTDREREIMNSHVTATARILSEVFFPKKYEQTPVWAAGHHELLNGRGYPEHLTAERIPKEVRLLTILDVFDALTAQDRPYKPPMPPAKALGVLHSMADEGSIDADILAIFEQSKAWEVLG